VDVGVGAGVGEALAVGLTGVSGVGWVAAPSRSCGAPKTAAGAEFDAGAAAGAPDAGVNRKRSITTPISGSASTPAMATTNPPRLCANRPQRATA
jgi:hypothetical protein